MDEIEIKPLDEEYRQWAASNLQEQWGSTRVVSKGQLYEPATLPGFVAFQDGKPVGLATYRIDGSECEIVTLNSTVEGKGAGSALIDAVRDAAISVGCNRLWLITTNDNTHALRFYQRRGFTLSALYSNALEASRKLKPEIPMIGDDGIPLRDEIELEMPLDGAGGA